MPIYLFKLFFLLPSKVKRKFYISLPFAFISSLLELIAISSLIPVFQMIFEQNVNYDFQYLKFLKILVSEQNEYSIFILIVSIFFLKAIYQLIFFRFFLQLIYEIKVNLQKLAINSYLSTNLDYFNKIKQSTFTSKIHIETNLIADQGLLSFIKIFIEISTVTLLMSLILISDLFVVIFLLLFGS